MGNQNEENQKTEESVNLEDIQLEKVNEVDEVHEEKIKKEKKKINIKKIVTYSIVSILCLGAGYSYGKTVGRDLPATYKNYGNKVVASIGENEIKEKELQYRMDPIFYSQGKNKMDEEMINMYEISMIEYITTTEILYLEGKEAGISATQEEIDGEYNSFVSTIPESFQMTEEDYFEKFNVTEEKIKNDLEKEIIAAKFIVEKATVGDDEAKTYFESNKEEFKKVSASHILIKHTTDEEKETNKAKIQDILDKVNTGEDFKELAKEYSEDISASQGGDLGTFGKGEMIEPFEKVAFSLKVGEVSEIVETDFGYHIIQKTGESYSEFETIKDDLKENISYNKQELLVTDLMEKYNVDIK